MWLEIAKIAVPVAIAVLGFLAKYAHDLSLTRRKERLEYIERQLRDLYGPLFALANASEMAYHRAFREFYRPGGIPMWNPPDNDPSRVTTSEEVAAFHQWVRAVFMPNNRRMVTIIIDHTDLLVEDEMPECVLQLLAHVSAYEGIINEWDNKNELHHTPTIRYPGEILAYASHHYVSLKRQQSELQRIAKETNYGHSLGKIMPNKWLSYHQGHQFVMLRYYLLRLNPTQF
jgi:hypothetical protein